MILYEYYLCDAFAIFGTSLLSPFFLFEKKAMTQKGHSSGFQSKTPKMLLKKLQFLSVITKRKIKVIYN